MKAAAKNPEFDSQKLKELILHFSQNCHEDRYFGSVNLNKMLFASDFLAYIHLGKSVTGATYVHRARGPVPKLLVPLRKELIDEGRLKIEERAIGPHVQKKPIALKGPDLSGFSREELDICEAVLKDLSGMRAIDVSDWSHDWPAYMLSEEGEEIPYFTAWLGTSKQAVTHADQRWAQEAIAAIR